MALITVFETQNITGFSLNSFYGVFVSSVSPMPFQLVAGEEYVVFWDSDSFTRTAFSFNGPDGSTCIGVGNKMAYTGEDDGDPFVIVCDYTNGYTHFMAKDTNTEHEVGVHISDGGTMVLKDRTGADLPGIESAVELRVPTSGGKFQSFIGGVRTNKTLHSNEVDFSVGDIVITPRKGEVFGTITVPKPPALLPENILEGVTIAGVDGTAKDGGDIQILTKPIRFYNAYGDVLFSFSRKEIKEMTELPEGPALGNLSFYAWSVSLEDLKNELYFCDVAPKYKNSSGQAVAVIILDIPTDSTSITMYAFGQSGTSYWDFGDGGTTSSNGTTSSIRTITHTYSKAGRYIVSIYADKYFYLGSNFFANYFYSLMKRIGSSSYKNGTGTYVDNYVVSVLGNVEDAKIAVCSLACSNNLKFVGESQANYIDVSRYLNCSALKAISISPKDIENGSGGWDQTISADYVYHGCGSLKRTRVLGSYANQFDFCTSLEEVQFGTGSLAYPEMNTKFSMLMTSTTPNNITATKPRWGTKPIYVPDEAVDAYKTASGWSNAAAYIYPASEYPDK